MNRMPAHQGQRCCIRYSDRCDDWRAVHDAVTRRVEAYAAQQSASYIAISHGTDNLSIALDDGQLQIALIDAPQRLDQGRVFPDNKNPVHAVLPPSPPANDPASTSLATTAPAATTDPAPRLTPPRMIAPAPT